LKIADFELRFKNHPNKIPSAESETGFSTIWNLKSVFSYLNTTSFTTSRRSSSFIIVNFGFHWLNSSRIQKGLTQHIAYFLSIPHFSITVHFPSIFPGILTSIWSIPVAIC
jgi:hypothetical protein